MATQLAGATDVNVTPPPAPAVLNGTFAQLKASGFKDIAKDQLEHMLYLEQLASTTGTNISTWPLLEMIYKLTSPSKQDLNKLFFDRAGNAEADLADTIKAMEPILAKLDDSFSKLRVSQMRTMEENANYAISQSEEYHARAMQKLQEACLHRNTLQALETGKTPDKIKLEIEKILQNKFWQFDSAIGTRLKFITATPVIIHHVHAPTKVDVRVDLGHLYAELDIFTRAMAVKKAKGAPVQTSHPAPYISSSGSICWGNAQSLVSQKLVSHEYAAVMDLLASLLTSYSVDTNPYITIVGLAELIKLFPQRLGEPSAQGEAPEQTPPSNVHSRPEPGQNCSYCVHFWRPEGDPRRSSGRIYCQCDWCEICELREQDCTCNHCSGCGVTYRDGESCGGNVCSVCDECYGEDPCEDHYCSICGTTNDGGCDCCGVCDRPENNCNRCRECEAHDPMEHATGCSNAPETEEEEEATHETNDSN